jgi:hypothetical protein
MSWLLLVWPPSVVGGTQLVLGFILCAVPVLSHPVSPVVLTSVQTRAPPGHGSSARRPPCGRDAGRWHGQTTSMPGQAASPAAKGRSRTLRCHLASEMPAGRRICTPNEGSLWDMAGDGPWAHFALPVLDVSSVRRPAGGRKVALNIGSVAGCGGLGLPASVAGRTLLRSPVAFRTDVGVRARGGHVGAPRGRFRDRPPSGCGSSVNRVLSGYRVRPAHSGASRGPAWAGCCPSRPCAATRTRAGPGGIDGGGHRPRGRPPVAFDMACCCPRRQWSWVSCGQRPRPAPELSSSQLAELVSKLPAIQVVCRFDEGRQGKSRGPKPRSAAVRA